MLQLVRPTEPTAAGDFGPHVVRHEAGRATRSRSQIDLHARPDQQDLPQLLRPRADSYRLLGLFPTQPASARPAEPGERFFLFGADRLGRDMLSRIIYGHPRSRCRSASSASRLSLILGVMLGGISGYYGGRIDFVIQRVIEFVLSLPTIPIWLGLSAATAAGLAAG